MHEEAKLSPDAPHVTLVDYDPPPKETVYGKQFTANELHDNGIAIRSCLAFTCDTAGVPEGFVTPNGEPCGRIRQPTLVQVTPAPRNPAPEEPPQWRRAYRTKEPEKEPPKRQTLIKLMEQHKNTELARTGKSHRGQADIAQSRERTKARKKALTWASCQEEKRLRPA